ncbi:MAG: hypothetical protein ACI9F9_003026 [Candidatus Paceibacteria bacterium]|jgi:hypothetical protein
MIAKKDRRLARVFLEDRKRVTTATRTTLSLALVSALLFSCASNGSHKAELHSDPAAAFDYLANLKGDWVVQGGDEGPFGWNFDTTARGGVILERLKVGTPTEMTTVHHQEDGALIGSQFCQLGNQPRVLAVESEVKGDLHFECDGRLGGAESHDDLHMHGVHFQMTGERLRVWMDMFKDGELEFETSYQLLRK